MNLQEEIIEKANSMKLFAEGDKTFCFGEWRAWAAACKSSGKALPPSDFKKPKKEKQ